MFRRRLRDRPKLYRRTCPIEGRLGHFGYAGCEQGLSLGVANFEDYPGPLHLRAFHPLTYRNPVNHRKPFPLCEQEVLVQGGKQILMEGEPARMLIGIGRRRQMIQLRSWRIGHGERV